MQLFSQLQSFIYFDNTSISRLSNSFGKAFEDDLRIVYEDYARLVNNNSSTAVYSGQKNSNMHASPINLLKNDVQTKETKPLLDLNTLDVNNKVNNYHIFLIIEK